MAHYYEYNGRKIPSVTTIIDACINKSGALTQWAANMVVEWIKQNCKYNGTEPSKPYWIITEPELNEARFNFKTVSQDALDVGSEVHQAIEKHLRGEGIGKLSKQASMAFDAFLEFRKEHNLIPFSLEETIYGDCWAGTLDFYGLYRGKIYVIDFKASKAIYADSYGPQISAYRSKKPDAEGNAILRLDKETGMPQFRDFSKRYEKDLKVFKAMVRLYMLSHPQIAQKAGWKGDD